MMRSKALLVWGLLLCAAGFLVSNGCGGSSSQKSEVLPSSAIQHVVVIFQENRSPDNLFQDPKLIAAGANIKNYGISATQPGVHIPLTPVPLGCPPADCTTYNPDHSRDHCLFEHAT